MNSHILWLYLPYMEDENKPKCFNKLWPFATVVWLDFLSPVIISRSFPRVSPGFPFHVGFNISEENTS